MHMSHSCYYVGMPSWNVHIAHVERLLEDGDLCSPVVRNRDAFVLGNLIPDVYVGYMVPDVSRKIPYRDTHYANPDFVPTPDASRFYCTFVRGRTASELVVGTWCHLLCDHYYNLRTTQYIESIGVKAGDVTRRRKQADFDLYGRTYDISLVPTLDDEVLAQCAAFEQYELDASDMRRTVAAAKGIVRANQEHHVSGVPDYDLLTPEFFATTADEVDAVLREAIALYATGRDASHLGNPTP